MKKIIFIFFIISLILICTSCSHIESSNTDNNLLLLSGLKDTESKVTMLNEDLEVGKSITPSIKGLFKAYSNGDKLVFNQKFGEKLLKLNKRGEEETVVDTQFSYPIHYLESKNRKALIFNYDKNKSINHYTYKFLDKSPSAENSTNNVIKRFKGIPMKVTHSDDFLYVFSRDMTKKKIKDQFSIKKINMDSGELVRQVHTESPYVASDMIIKNQKLYLSGNVFMEKTNKDMEYPSSKLFTYELKTFEADEINLEDQFITSLVSVNNHIYSLSRGEEGTEVSKVEKNSLEVINNFENISVKKAVSDENNVYMLSGKGESSEVTKYNIEENTIRSSSETFKNVQDMILISN